MSDDNTRHPSTRHPSTRHPGTRHPSVADLESRLRAACTAQDGGDDRPRQGAKTSSGVGLAARIGVELVTTTLVGTGMGYFLDTWLGTVPWLMIVFMVLGGAAGVFNVYRVVKGLDDAVGLGRALEDKKRRDAAKGRDILDRDIK